MKCPSIYSCVLANPESFMTKIGVEKVLSRLGTQKTIKVGFSRKKKAQVKGSLKPFEKAKDRLKQTLVTEWRQWRGKVRQQVRCPQTFSTERENRKTLWAAMYCCEAAVTATDDFWVCISTAKNLHHSLLLWVQQEHCAYKPFLLSTLQSCWAL